MRQLRNTLFEGLKSRRYFLLPFSAGVLVLFLLFYLFGYEQTWQLWDIPVISPHFADVRTITHGAESYAQGLDPLLKNPADPWQRPMNYPRIWQLVIHIGITPSGTTLLGLVFITLFIVGLILWAKNLSLRASLFLIAVVFSPSVLLGIERANNDLVIFALIAAAIVWLRTLPGLSSFFLISATVLKLFPIFAFSAFIGLGKYGTRPVLVSVVILTFYLVYFFEDLLLIKQNTPIGTWYSYGISVFATAVERFFGSHTLGRIFVTFSWLVALVALSVAVWAKHKKPAMNCNAVETHLDAFRMGASIYVGTFFLGNNWDYRMMFLLFVVPQLAYWASSTATMISRVSKLTLAAVLLSVWSMLLQGTIDYILDNRNVGFVLDEAANWVLFFSLLFLLVYTLPRWVGVYFRQHIR